MSGSSGVGAPPSVAGLAPTAQVVEPYEPFLHATVLLLERQYWDRIVKGEKTIEIRGRRLKSKRYHVGRRGEMWGTIVLGPGTRIETDEQWRALLPSHCWDVDRLPYADKTWALPICEVQSFTRPIGYAMKSGQQGVAKYRPLERHGAEVPGAGLSGRCGMRQVAAVPAQQLEEQWTW